MMRSRRGQAAEVPPERVFGRLWGRMTDQGWRVMAKPHWFARGDPRTWIYCAPEVLDAAGKLRRDAGKLGESIFLDKGDLWAWAQRNGWALPADDDDDATGDDEGSPSSADEPERARVGAIAEIEAAAGGGSGGAGGAATERRRVVVFPIVCL